MEKRRRRRQSGARGRLFAAPLRGECCCRGLTGKTALRGASETLSWGKGGIGRRAISSSSPSSLKGKRGTSHPPPLPIPGTFFLGDPWLRSVC